MVQGDMPPKPRYSRDAVLDAALDVTRRDGLAAVSARSVAKELQSSTAPVSSYFGSMEELIGSLVESIIDMLNASVDEAEGHDALLDGSFAMVRFCAREPRLYEALFLTTHTITPDWVAFRRRFSRGLGRSSRYASLSARARDAIAWRASVVTHGICIEVWSRRWTKTKDAQLRRLVDELVEPVVAAHLSAP